MMLLVMIHQVVVQVKVLMEPLIVTIEVVKL